jgi:carboxylate-amine ligase
MSSFSFIPSQNPYSVGAELESWLIDDKSFDTTSKAKVLIENIPQNLKSYIHEELLESMIEIVTPVCASPKEVCDSLYDLSLECNEIGKKEGFFLCALCLLFSHAAFYPVVALPSKSVCGS